MVGPKAEEKREPAYRVVALNAPDPSLLLRLIEVAEKEQGNRNRGDPSVLISERAFRDIAKKD